MADLKPCPFCGTNNAELRHNKDGFSFVICVKDGCYCRTDGHLNEKAAVEAWNRRAESVKEQPADDVVEVVRCKDCAIPHNRFTGCPKLNGLIPLANHFCSYGERKEGDDNA